MEYKRLVDVYEQLEGTTKKLEKRDIAARFLGTLPDHELPIVIRLIQGKVFPEWDERKIGFGSQLVIKALAQVTGSRTEDIEKKWSKLGDLGLLTEELIGKNKQTTLFQPLLSVEKVYDNIRKLAELAGEGTVKRKISYIAELLASASPVEAKFIVRTVLEDLRVGVAEGIIRDAIAQLYNKEPKEIEHAFALIVDYGEVAKLAKANKLGTISLKPGKPINVMLAQIADSAEMAFDDFGKEVQCEYKLDGFRLQIHYDGTAIKLFTRRLENVTAQFPDVTDVIKKHVKGGSYILDAEIVGYSKKTKKYQPFQMISQRIKRKYDIHEMAQKFPVEVNLFDVVYYNGKSLMDEALRTRRKILEKIVRPEQGMIRTTEKLVASSAAEAKKFFKEALARGTEGLMMKNLDAHYRPGRYVGGWMKLKQVLEPLDLVIVGADYGTGKRAGVLSSYALACREDNKFLECGMVSTGVKEKEGETGVTYEELTNLLKPLIISQEGRHVRLKPRIVVEVKYEEIQKSPTYKSGYALRFPRFSRLRIDEKGPKDANNLEDIERIFNLQKRKF